MILDKKLQLASNMSIGTVGRDFAGCKTSTDVISAAALRDFGRGETVYMCVTVKSNFTINATSYIGMSLCASHLADPAGLQLISVGVNPQTALLYHRLQPKLAFSGYIPGNTTGLTNFIAGKKFVFPVTGMTSKYKDYASLAPGLGGDYLANKDVYFLFEEVDGTNTSIVAASNITSGSIDVDIVTIAESGAGPGFNDQVCYPTSIKVQ